MKEKDPTYKVTMGIMDDDGQVLKEKLKLYGIATQQLLMAIGVLNRAATLATGEWAEMETDAEKKK